MNKVSKKLVSLNQDIAGQSIGIPVYHITSETNGSEVNDGRRTVYIQSAVHAAEMQGSAVILKLIESLRQTELFADFILVPNCNPFGRTQRAGEYLQGRFDATNGNNWNRFYHYDESEIESFYQGLNASNGLGDEQSIVKKLKAYLAEKLDKKLDSHWGINTAQFLNTRLQQMAVTADLVLDLHTGPSSTRHIYSPNSFAEQARKFNIENIISIPEKFAGALDEACFTPTFKLGQLFAEDGLEFNYRTQAFTVELGSQENICLAQAAEDASGIINYLMHQGFIAQSQNIPSVESTITLLRDYRTLFSSHAGMMEYLAKPGQKVTKGQVIARVLNSLEFDSDKAIVEILAPASGTVILHYPSAAVQVGTQLYKIAVDQF